MHYIYGKYFKRMFDILLAVIALPFALVILIIVCPIIYLQDGRPIFYNSMRLGRYGKCFKMYKLRTMKTNSPDIRNEDGSTYNSENDPRLTKIGKIIRKTSIDELPQIINIIKGDMSFIGPRPDLPEDINLYNEYQKRKLCLRPGITGYSQAYFRNSASQEEKFNNDSYYADNLTFLFDVKIILKTIETVLKEENVYKNDDFSKKAEKSK